jgi:thiamine biosynthesis lipoprotein
MARRWSPLSKKAGVGACLRLAAWLVVLSCGRAAAQLAPTPRARLYTREAHLMGSHFTFTAVSADDSLAWRALRAGLRPW